MGAELAPIPASRVALGAAGQVLPLGDLVGVFGEVDASLAGAAITIPAPFFAAQALQGAVPSTMILPDGEDPWNAVTSLPPAWRTFTARLAWGLFGPPATAGTMILQLHAEAKTAGILLTPPDVPDTDVVEVDLAELDVGHLVITELATDRPATPGETALLQVVVSRREDLEAELDNPASIAGPSAQAFVLQLVRAS